MLLRYVVMFRGVIIAHSASGINLARLEELMTLWVSVNLAGSTWGLG
jgi:hypothetical protein